MSRLSILTLALLPVLAAWATEATDLDADGAFEAVGATKVAVCHFNNGQGEYTLVDIADSAVDTHLGHGDTLAADDSVQCYCNCGWCGD